MVKQSPTNELTNRILNDLFYRKIFAWRHNSAPIPVTKGRSVIGFRSGGKSGQPDIVGILHPLGRYFGIEIKVGKDKLRETQISFHLQAEKSGALIFVVKTWEEYISLVVPLLEKVIHI